MIHTVPLLVRSFRYYWRLFGTGALIVATFFSLVSLVGLVEGSAGRAVADSITADYGGRAFAIQVRDAEKAIPVLTSLPNLTPIADSAGSVAHETRLIQADVRRTPDKTLTLGSLTAGTTPSRAGEAMITQSVAEALVVAIGDRVTVDVSGESETWQIVGLITDPAQDDAAAIVGLVDRVAPSDVTVWVTDVDPFSDPRLATSFDDESVAGRTVATLAVDEQEAAGNRNFVYARVLEVSLAIGLIWFLFFYLPIVATATRPSVQGLRAAGMDDGRITRLASVLIGTTLAAALLLGYLAAIALGHLYAEQFSRLVGQDWITVRIPVAVPAALTLGVSVVVVVMLALGRRTIQLPTLPASLTGRPWLAIAGGATASTAALSIPLTLTRMIDVKLSLFLLLGAAVLSPFVLNFVANETSRMKATRQALRGLSSRVIGLAVIVAVISALSSAYAARAVHDDRTAQASSITSQPAGSLALYQVPGREAERLHAAYRELGGRKVLDWVLPNETGRYLRVTRPALLECMQQLGIADPFVALESCGTTSSEGDARLVGAQVEFIVLNPDHTSVPTAAVGTVQDNRIGLVQYDDVTGEVVDLAFTGGVSSDARLGGTLPGAVIPLDGPVAESFGLTATDSHLMVFEDFGRLDPQTQAQFRGTAARLSGAAQVAEDNFAAQGASMRLAVIVGVGAAAFLVLIVWFGGGLVHQSSMPLLRAMCSMGATPRRRTMLAARLFGPLALASISGSGWGLAGAWLVGAKDGLGFGWPWLAGPTGCLITVVIVAVRWSSGSATASPRE